MASLMEVLIDVLEQENQEYEKLLINRLDHQRNEAVNDIADVLNKDVDKLKIVDLIRMLAARPEEQEKLAIVFDKLRGNVRSVKRVNEQNRELINDALELVRFNMNVLQAMNKAPESANYNRGACNTGDMIGTSHMTFDAKQ